MAFVEGRVVHTNMSDAEFEEVKAALQARPRLEDIKFFDHSVFVGVREAKFTYRGNTYSISEDYEVVTALRKV